MQQISSNKHFGGLHQRYKHFSSSCDCDMTFAVYTPPQVKKGKVPVLYWLSGLTCNDENFSNKAGAQRYAAEHGIMLVIPDTSPRGLDLAGENDSYDFGTGAGFYLNATEQPWAKHYRMYDYIVDELPKLIAQHFPADMGKQSISGHSMGGHGALIIGLQNPDIYRSVSAFAPICAPSQVAWGQKALSGYLGNNPETWKKYDATTLVLAGAKQNILIDQGDADEFLAEQLKPELFKAACEQKGVTLDLRIQPGYDHSYFFIATFIGEHIQYHANYLRQA